MILATTARKNKKIEKTAYDTYASDSKIAVIMFEGKQFHLRSRYYPDLYDEYVARKEINIDFSGAKTAKDIEALYQNFIKRFKDFPTAAQIKIAAKEYNTAHKNEKDSFIIESISRAILRDLGRAGANPRVSDERYAEIVEYLKDVIHAAANGEDVSNMGEKRGLRKLLNKVTPNEPLSDTKHIFAMYTKQIPNIPSKQLLELLSYLPKTRMKGGAQGECKIVDDYADVFRRKSVENTKICDKKGTELMFMLFKDKIMTDGLRTFEVMAKQHMYKLEKEEQHFFAALAKAANRVKNEKQGLLRKRMANMYGPVDPVTRTIAKIKKDSGRK